MAEVIDGYWENDQVVGLFQRRNEFPFGKGQIDERTVQGVRDTYLKAVSGGESAQLCGSEEEGWRG